MDNHFAKNRLTLAPRRNWGKRLGRAIIGLGIAVLIAHAVWTLVEVHLLRQRIEAFRTSGQPLLPEDFAVAYADGSDNAATALMTAAASLHSDKSAWDQFDEIALDRTWTQNDLDTAHKIVERSAAVFDAILSAQKKPRCEWPIDVRQPALIADNSKAQFEGMRALARLLCIAARVDHSQGNDRLALQRIEQTIFVAGAMDRHPTLIGHLVASGCRSLAVDALTKIIPDLRIETENGAAKSDLRSTIARLLDDQQETRGFERGFRGERMWALAMMSSMFSASSSQQVREDGKTWATRYFSLAWIDHNSRTLLDRASSVLQLTAQQRTWPAARARMPGEAGSASTMMADLLLAGMNRAVEEHYRVLTDNHLAAATLALKWYAHDHGEALPASLIDLTPAYLPVTATDAMAPHAPALRFHGDVADPMIYSVGANGVDDGGSQELLPGFKRRSNPWNCLDRVVHLKSKASDGTDGAT